MDTLDSEGGQHQNLITFLKKPTVILKLIAMVRVFHIEFNAYQSCLLISALLCDCIWLYQQPGMDVQPCYSDGGVYY